MAQSVINYATKHAVAGSTRLVATTATGGHGIVDIKISKDLDNGCIIGKGALVAGEVYAMASSTAFAGKIIDKASNGNWYVEVTAIDVDAPPVFLYNSPIIEDERYKDQPDMFFNANGDTVKGYVLELFDVFEESEAIFTFNTNKATDLKEGATVAVDTTNTAKLKVTAP